MSTRPDPSLLPLPPPPPFSPSLKVEPNPEDVKWESQRARGPMKWEPSEDRKQLEKFGAYVASMLPKYVVSQNHSLFLTTLPASLYTPSLPRPMHK